MEGMILRYDWARRISYEKDLVMALAHGPQKTPPAKARAEVFLTCCGDTLSLEERTEWPDQAPSGSFSLNPREFQPSSISDQRR